MKRDFSSKNAKNEYALWKTSNTEYDKSHSQRRESDHFKNKSAISHWIGVSAEDSIRDCSWKLQCRLGYTWDVFGYNSISQGMKLTGTQKKVIEYLVRSEHSHFSFRERVGPLFAKCVLNKFRARKEKSYICPETCFKVQTVTCPKEYHLDLRLCFRATTNELTKSPISLRCFLMPIA